MSDQNAQNALDNQILTGDIKYIVTSETVNGFVIKINKLAPVDIPFAWTAIATTNGTTSTTNVSVPATNQPATTPAPAPVTSIPSPSILPSPTPSVTVSEPSVTPTIISPTPAPTVNVPQLTSSPSITPPVTQAP